MTNQLELSLPRGIRHSVRGVFLPEDLTQAQWEEYGRFCRRADEALHFWKADWLRFGSKHFGDDVVRKVVEQLDFDFADLKCMKALSAFEGREPALSMEHHFVLSQMKSAEDQAMWSDLAKKEKLTARELLVSYRKGTVTRIEKEENDGNRNCGIATVEGVRQMWEFLMKQVGDAWRDWTYAERTRFMQEIRPIVEFWDELVKEAAKTKGGAK